ncbi:MAG: acyl-CoA/acyl-ACP dehydrogenase [Rhodococcus sp.]|nr:acyl-CoA/acyl-ACP dehydrogenase [Rhodococcus sp. (in: high G+C Gram-positive bacteria)]
MTDVDGELVGSAGAATRMPEVLRVVDGVAAIAADCAGEVDAHSRFPHEAVAAMREGQLLTCGFPGFRGGYGLSLHEIAAVVRMLSSRCAATGMIFAMHQTLALTLVRHAEGPDLEAFLGEMLENQYLLAAATTESTNGAGVIDAQAGFVGLTKHARMIAYAEYCDAILATATPSQDASPEAQVLAVCRRSNLTLERTESWEVMGLRGVNSPSYVVRATTVPRLILSEPYPTIFVETIRPIAFVLWAAVCLGIADAAVEKALRYVADEGSSVRPARNESQLRLPDVLAQRDMFASIVDRAAESWDTNQLEMVASQFAVDIVASALAVCGMDGYRSTGAYTIERHLRDAHGAALLLNSYRAVADSA